jgi:hypothetical protein
MSKGWPHKLHMLLSCSRSTDTGCRHGRWRDHLLAGILRQVGGFVDGLFAFLYPKDNPDCAQAVAGYRECLKNSVTFEDWTLEKFTAIVKKHTTATWVDDFTDRDLNVSKLGDI